MGKRTDVHIGTLATGEVLCGEGVYHIWAAVPDRKDPRVSCQKCLEIANGVRPKPQLTHDEYDMLGRVNPLYKIQREAEIQAQLAASQQSRSLRDLQASMGLQAQAMQNMEALRNVQQSQLFMINPGHNTIIKDLGSIGEPMHHKTKDEPEHLAPIFKTKINKPQKSHTLTKIFFSAFFAIVVFGSVLFFVGKL